MNKIPIKKITFKILIIKDGGPIVSQKFDAVRITNDTMK